MNVIVVTSSSPFGNAEGWVRQEAPYWPLDSVRFTVLPLATPGKQHPLPTGVELDTTLAQLWTRRRKVAYTFLACGHVLVLRELLLLIRHRKLSARRILATIRVVGQTLLIRRGLARVVDRLGDDVDVYSYWHAPGTYAAVLLKRAGRVRRVVSRAHGSDVYEAISPAAWHPLKRQLVADVDRAWAVSEDGARELIERYSSEGDRVGVARLGITVPVRPGPAPARDSFRILSISSCSALKQVALIAGAVGRLAASHPEARVRWTHLGGGPEWTHVRTIFDDLRQMHPNLSGHLPGVVEHDELLDVLAREPFDVFVNASTSEGVPVSIMEAMGHGIPAIAPDVGGVRELVSDDVGWLLPRRATEADVARALAVALAEQGTTERREAARRRVVERFDAAENYQAFARELLTSLTPDQG